MENESMKSDKSFSTVLRNLEKQLNRELTYNESKQILENGRFSFLNKLYDDRQNTEKCLAKYKALCERISELCTKDNRIQFDKINDQEDLFHQTDYEGYDDPETLLFGDKQENTAKSPADFIDEIYDFVNSITPYKEKEITDEDKVQLAYQKFVAHNSNKNNSPTLDKSFDQECPVDSKVFGEEKSVDDCTILNLIPEPAKKWVDRLTLDEMTKVFNDLASAELWGHTEFTNNDEFVGELVDQLKNMAIAKYTNDILAGRISKIDDEEIKSEVVDYMKHKKMPIPTSLLPKECIFDKTLKETESTSIEDFIERLDEGEVLELPNDILTKIIDQLWDTRENVSIEVRNNKIRVK